MHKNPQEISYANTLPCSGLTPRGTGIGIIALPWEEENIYPAAVDSPWRGKMPVCGAPEGDPQADTAVVALPVMDIDRNMLSRQCQDIGTSLQRW